MYKNFNLWDRLTVCAVGRSWPPDFYSWVPDLEIRTLFEKIARETEEDYQTLIKCLTTLGVKVVRTNAVFDPVELGAGTLLPKPPMCPRDHMIMLGDTLIETTGANNHGSKTEINVNCFKEIFDHVRQQGNKIKSVSEDSLCAAMIYQLDNKIFFSSNACTDKKAVQSIIAQHRPNTEILPFYNHGHIDGWFAPVNQNLIVSSTDETRPKLLDLFYKTFFPNTKVLYLDPSVGADCSFIQWQKNNQGKWWIPGQENNFNLTQFVSRYFDHWLGQISETVFEVNMIIVDSKNVIVSNYNDTIWQIFEQHGITAHVCKFRHEKFWDAGLSCVTCELDRSNS